MQKPQLSSRSDSSATTEIRLLDIRRELLALGYSESGQAEPDVLFFLRCPANGQCVFVRSAGPDWTLSLGEGVAAPTIEISKRATRSKGTGLVRVLCQVLGDTL